MQFLLISILVAALVFIIIGFFKGNQVCPPRRIEYRYVPRNFIEDQLEPVSVSEIFGDMFRNPTVWVGGFSNTYYPKQEDINRFFVSQS